MGLYEKHKKLKKARQNGFISKRILKLTIKISSNLSNIFLCYYLEFQMPMCHRKLFRISYENPDYVKIHCNDRSTAFHFRIRKSLLKNSSKKNFII